MPELPEVETVKRQLAKKIIGKTIIDIKINKQKQFQGNTNNILGKKIVKVERRAKYILITLKNNFCLLVHLKMTGQLIYVDKKGKYGGGHPIPPFNLKIPNKYTHIEIYFDDKSVLYYNDLRQFGWMKIVNLKELNKIFAKTGIEPLDGKFTLAIFTSLLAKKPKSKIKLFLMDQNVIAGIGNIYASEICFSAKVLPMRINNTLLNKEIKNLYIAIKSILQKAIKYQGTSANDYVTLQGIAGKYDKMLKVYNRKDGLCYYCKSKIKKIKLGQRGTYFCPNCQK